MQAEDGLDETGDAGGRAPDLAEDPPGFEGRDGPFDEGADLRVGPVGCLLTGGKCLPSAAVGNPDRAACALVALGVTVAQMGQGEQSLPTDAQTPPSGADLPAVPAQASGKEAQGRAGHVQPGRVDKHAKPLVETDFLVENPSTRGFRCLSAQPPSPASVSVTEGHAA